MVNQNMVMKWYNFEVFVNFGTNLDLSSAHARRVVGV